MVTGAINRDIDVIFTNSDGNPERRDFPAHEARERGNGADHRPRHRRCKGSAGRLDYRRP